MSCLIRHWNGKSTAVTAATYATLCCYKRNKLQSITSEPSEIWSHLCERCNCFWFHFLLYWSIQADASLKKKISRLQSSRLKQRLSVFTQWRQLGTAWKWVTLESKSLKDLGRDDGRKEWEQSAAFKVWTSRSRKGTKNTWREADGGGSSSSDGQPVSQLENQKQWQVLLQKLCIAVFHNIEQIQQVINCSFLGETLMIRKAKTYCELSYVPLGHQVMLVLWSDAVTYPLQDTTPQPVSGQTRSHFARENVTSEERGNSQESAGRFQGFRNSHVSREARSFSPFWFRSGDWHWLCSDQIADFTQWSNTCLQSGCEQILIGSTCCQRNVGGASVVANDSRSMLHLMITITELAKLWSDGFFQKLSIVLSQQQSPAVYTVICCLQSVTLTHGRSNWFDTHLIGQ